MLNTYPMVGDFDGDGKSEILVLKATDLYTPSYSANYLIGENYLYESSPGVLLAKQLKGMPFDATYVYKKDNSRGRLFVIDYDGDGKNEVLSIWYDVANNVHHAQVFRLNVTFDANNKPVVGNPAFLLVNDSDYPTISHETFTADFNGDGITDYLTWMQGRGWRIVYGTGDGSVSPLKLAPDLGGKPTNDLPISTDRAVVIGDFNGDGKSDIYNYTSQDLVPYSFGSYRSPEIFYSKGNNQFVQESVAAIEDKVNLSLKNYSLGDFNGDGQTDFLSFDFGGPLYRFCFHPNEKRHLISKIKNGLESETKITYDYLTNATVYQPGTNIYSYPFINKTIPIKVIKTINTDNGVNTVGNNINYNYTGLKFNLHGKGLMGFDRVTINDVVTPLTTLKIFGLNTTYAFPYLEKVESMQSTYILNRTTSEYSVHHFGSKRIFPHISVTEKSDFVSNLYSREEYKYNAPAGTQPHGYTLGKPNRIITRNGYTLGSAPSAPVQQELTEQEFKYPDIPNSLPIHRKAKPYSVITSNIRQGQPIYSRRQDFTYYAATGLVHTTVSDPSTPKAVTTTLTYDAHGNITSQSKSATGYTTRTESYLYDASKRYITQSWNTAFPNVKIMTTYDILSGKPLTIRDPDGLITTYTYDAFGRIKTVSDDNGTTTTKGYYDGLGVSYWPTSARYVITSTSNTGVFSYQFYDRLGRLVRSATKGFNGQIILADKQYNNKGQLIRTTKPYFQGGSPQNTTLTYDIRGRLTQEARPEGTNTLSYLIVGNNYQVTATNAAGQEKKTLTDKSGKTVQVVDHGGTLSYAYHSSGNVLQTSLSGAGVVSTKEYDIYGNLTKDTDPNYGSYEYTYSSYGELIQEKDPKGKIFNFTYNQGGYMTQRSGPQGVFDYTYNYSLGTNCGKLTQVNRQGGGTALQINYDYGLGHKLNYEERIMGTEILKTQYTYDAFGRVATRVYPNNRTMNYVYNNNDGSLARIWTSLQSNTDLYTVTQKNAYGQPLQEILGRPQGAIPFAANKTYAYNVHGLLSGRFGHNYSGSVEWDNIYDFQLSTGNLLFRDDYIAGLEETFTFDNLNRLIHAESDYIGTPPSSPIYNLQNITYSSRGNILSKTDAGTFAYDVANRVSEISDYVDIPISTQRLTYTAFNKVDTIEENGKLAAFSYWPDEERGRMDLIEGGNIKKTKYYASDYEKELIYMPGNTITRELCYIPGPDGRIIAIHERRNGVNKMFYTITDYLGSITHILDENGNLVEERSFDAWGRKRDPDTWVPKAPVSGSLTDEGWDRGYTGHEHLPQFGIINMNGRLYDPVMGRMFSPDPYIMGSDNTQGYNRYTYALNNPLYYTDPSGEIVWAPIIIGAVVGAYMGASMANNSYNPGNWEMGSARTWTWMAGGAVVGAISGGIGGAIASSGGAFSNTLALVGGSFTNSVGTAIYTGGATNVSASFGIGSYDFTKGKFNGLWNWGNLNTAEKIGYSFGALANLQDVVAGFSGSINVTRAEHGDGILHARSRGEYVDATGTTQNYDISVSHVNSGVYKYNGNNGLLENLDYARYWGTHLDAGEYYAGTAGGWKATLYNVNSKIMGKMYGNISGRIPKSLWGLNDLKYGTTVSGCYGQVARSLFSVGVPTIPFYGFTPHGLVLQLWARQAGIWASPILINR